MEKNPWYKNVEGPFLQWKGPVGIKEDGGGCTRAQGRVGNMVVHRAAFNKNAAAIKKAVESGEDVNEDEGAGNTPLHCAAYAGWEEGCEDGQDDGWEDGRVGALEGGIGVSPGTPRERG